mmetsp:Transcript_175921/g.564062  ORF Transcript_175921/g.564062 Transcript_175921/m.564062 type:complete len:252 (+) Transcript_175921:88-843(+)
MRPRPPARALRPSRFFATAIAVAAALSLASSSSSSHWGVHTWLSVGLKLPGTSTTRLTGPSASRRLLALRSSSGTDTPTQAESYLLSWGLSEQQLDQVRARYGRNSNFNPNVEDKVKPLLNWLADLGLTQLQILKAVVDCPGLFRQRLEQNVKPSVRWLLEMGLDKSQVTKMIARQPRLCSYNLERTLKPRVQWLSELGMEKSQIAKAISACPAIFGYSLERKMQLLVQWLSELGMEKSQIAKSIANKPQY